MVSRKIQARHCTVTKKMVLIIEMDLRMILMGKFRLVFPILDFAGSKKIVIYVCLFSKQVKLKSNYRHVY